MKFVKMQGCGNDYVYINSLDAPLEHPSDVAIQISDRHFGVGSDGLVLILPSECADFRMCMFNSDGTEAEMCGNAIRCVGKYVYDKGLTPKTTLHIETLAGIKTLHLRVDQHQVLAVTVDMGEPILEASKIPVASNRYPVIGEKIKVSQEEIPVTCISMGNPHAITFVEDVWNYPVTQVGPLIETDPHFPRKTNVEFARVLSRDAIEMRVWERGAGETLACGTGACATLVACALNDLTDREATIKLLGGDLRIAWDLASNHVWMTGSAQFVFDGEWLGQSL